MDFLPKIVYQDEDYLFCRKPHGIASTWGQEVSFLDMIQKVSSDDDGSMSLRTLKEVLLVEGTNQSIDDVEIWKQQISVFGRDWEFGLLNRLDNLTAGLLYFARSYEAKANYIHLQQKWHIQKIYYAKVYGTPKAQFGWIDTSIFHHNTDSTRMTIDPQKGKDKQSASTYREIVEWIPKWEFAWLKITISSWVRHQIRLHLASIGHPIVGDELYMTKWLKKRYGAFEHSDKIELVSGGVWLRV